MNEKIISLLNPNHGFNILVAAEVEVEEKVQVEEEEEDYY
jgi:hypothetical protein